jgi:hypothetical protein
MNAFLNHDDWPATGITAADPTSRGFLTPDFEGAQQDDLDPAARVVPRVRVRIYP